MTLNPENFDITNQEIEEMKEKYPEFKVISEGDKESELWHTAKVFLYSRKYNHFTAKFLMDLLPAAFAGVNIYNEDKFQYSVSTCSGEWHKKLKYLERIVGEIDEKGIGVVKRKFDGDRIGMDFTEF